MLNYQRVLDIEIMDSMFTTEDIFLYLHEFDHGPTVEWYVLVWWESFPQLAWQQEFSA